MARFKLGRHLAAACVIGWGLLVPLAVQAQPRDTVRIAVLAPRGLGTLDPHFATAHHDRMVDSWVYGALVRFKPGSISPAEIWWRFPKFVIGFLAASVIVTVAVRGYSMPKFNSTVVPVLVGPLKDLRSWAFIFCFLSIGLTTRFGDLARAGVKPVLAFSAGVVVNVALGLLLSAVVFASYWESLSP